MRFLIAVCGLFVLTATARGSEVKPPGGEAEEMSGGTSALIERYFTDYDALKRFYDVPVSPNSANRIGKHCRRWQSLLKRIDFDALDPDQRIDYLLLKNQVQRELGRIALRERAGEALLPLLPFAAEIVSLEESRRRMKSIKPQEAAARLARLGRQAKQVRQVVEAGLSAGDEAQPPGEVEPIEVNKVLANRAAQTTGQLQKTLKHWYDFYHGYDPLFTWWAAKPYEDADAELTEYVSLLRRRIVGTKDGQDAPLIGNPIGREALLSELGHELIPYTPEQLIAIARREFAWCEAELVRASRELGYADDWKKALEHVKTLHVPPGRQDDLVEQLAREAIEFVERKELVTVPKLCRELWNVSMMPHQQQLTTPYLSYGRNRVNVAFPTDRMSHEQKLMNMRGNNVHFSRAVVQHELIPGHHLQSFMAARYRTYRRPLSTAFFIEGWALHWEMLLWDLGFPRSPEDRIGMLFWRSHRCARIIVSLKFHLGEMSPEEMIDLLVERVGHERDGATAEVRRYIGDEYGPLYQCAYMIGGLQIRALHKELVGSGKWTNRRFHDALLTENVIPIELIRARLTDQHLSSDFTSTWKFAGPMTEEQ